MYKPNSSRARLLVAGLAAAIASSPGLAKSASAYDAEFPVDALAKKDRSGVKLCSNHMSKPRRFIYPLGTFTNPSEVGGVSKSKAKFKKVMQKVRRIEHIQAAGLPKFPKERKPSKLNPFATGMLTVHLGRPHYGIR